MAPLKCSGRSSAAKSNRAHNKALTLMRARPAGTALAGEELGFEPRRHPRALDQGQCLRHHLIADGAALGASHVRAAARSAAFDWGAPSTWRA